MNAKEGYFLDVLGDAYGMLGRHEEAIEAYCRAVDSFHAEGTEHAYVYCLLKIAVSYRALGREAHAVRYLQACLPLIRELRLAGYEEIALRELAACEVATVAD
jgi:tetratricopeptide (TPR) repeat protein